MALAASVVLGATTAVRDARRRAAPGPVGGHACDDVLTSPSPYAALSVAYDGTPAVVDADLDLRRGPGAGRARALRLRQVHAAARGRRARGRRPGAVAWDGADLSRTPDPQARLRADVPGRPAVPPPHRGPQRRLPAAAPAYAAGRGRRAGSPSCWSWSGCPGYADRLPGHAVRRGAAARRPGPRAGRVAAAAAARRAAERARRRPARAPGRRPARHPGRGRHHRGDGHPRPRGGVHGRRRPGRDARRPDRPVGPDRARSGGRRPTPRRRSSSATPGCSRATPRPGCSRRPGCPPAPAVAVRRSALAVADDGPIAGEVVTVRATPGQVRLVVPHRARRGRRGRAARPAARAGRRRTAVGGAHPAGPAPGRFALGPRRP